VRVIQPKIEKSVTLSTSPSSSPPTPPNSSPSHLVVAPLEQDNAIIDLPPDIFSEFLFFGDLDLDLNPSTMFQTPTPILPLQNAETEPNTTTDVCSDNSFMSFLNHLKTRVPSDSVDLVISTMLTTRQKLAALCNQYQFLVGQNPCTYFKAQVAGHAKVFQDIFSNIAVPTIVFEKIGIVHYVNPSFVNLVNFNIPVLPTLKEEYWFFKILSKETVKTYLMEYSRILVDPSIANSMFPASILSYTADQEELWLDGTMTITIRRDPVNLPILMAASFLPRLL